MGEWPHWLGSFILNFSAIEFISFKYLDALEATRADFNKTLTQKFSARIRRIKRLVNSASTLTQPEKDAIREAWDHASALSIWRDRMAHNPVLPTWKPGRDTKTDPPDLIGVPNIKSLRRTNISNTVSLVGLKAMVDDSAELGAQLLQLSEPLYR